MRRLVVDAVEHHVLEGDAAAVLLVDVVPAGLEELRDRVLAVDGHELVAQRVVGRMQRHRERAVGLLGELVDLRHEAGGRERDAAARDVEAEVVEHDAHRGHHVAEVGERLAHAHQHHVGDGPQAARLEAELAVGEPHLADDLVGGEVAVEALLRGRAERAVERAAHLRGDAERAAVGLRDEHHLEGLHAVGAQQPLAGAVGRVVARDDLRRADHGALGELRAEIAREVGHRREVALHALVHPVHELARAEGLAAERRDELLERGPLEPEQRGARVDGSGVHGRFARCAAISRAGRPRWSGRSTRSPARRSRDRPSRARCSPRCSARGRRGWCRARPSWGRWRP